MALGHLLDDWACTGPDLVDQLVSGGGRDTSFTFVVAVIFNEDEVVAFFIIIFLGFLGTLFVALLRLVLCNDLLFGLLRCAKVLLGEQDWGCDG